MELNSYNCRIQNHLQYKDKVYYCILIINNRDKNIRRLKLRYSECKDLHDQIHKIVKKYKIQVYLPIFPGRKMFGKTNKDENTIVTRRQELSQYFNELLNIPKLHSLDQFRQILLPDKVKEIDIDEEEKDELPDIFGQYDEDPEDFDLRAPEEGGAMRIKIDRYSVQEDIVNYFITIFDMQNRKDYTFKSRYSEIRALNESLQDNKQVKSKMPHFPKRKLFGITNENPEDIEKRRDQLETFLNQLFAPDEIRQTDIIRFFIEDGIRQANIMKQKEIQQMKKRRLKQMKSKKQEIIKVLQHQNELPQNEQDQQHIQKQFEILESIQDYQQKKKKKKIHNKFLDKVNEVETKYECENQLHQYQIRKEKSEEIISSNESLEIKHRWSIPKPYMYKFNEEDTDISQFNSEVEEQWSSLQEQGCIQANVQVKKITQIPEFILQQDDIEEECSEEEQEDKEQEQPINA